MSRTGKTARPIQFDITEQTREAVTRWLEKRDLNKGEPLLPDRINRRVPSRDLSDPQSRGTCSPSPEVTTMPWNVTESRLA